MSSARDLINRLRGKPKRTAKDILSSHKNKFTPPPAETITEKFPEGAIDIKNLDDFQKLKEKVENLGEFEKYKNNPQLVWLKVRIDQDMQIALKKFKTPDDFEDDELNLNLAKKIKSIAEIMLDIFSNCNSGTDLDDATKQNLKNIVEKYLQNIGVEKIPFSENDSYDSWANLGMQNSIITVTTNDPNLNGKIKAVEIQPHVIYYANYSKNLAKITFGGRCSVYKFNDS